LIKNFSLPFKLIKSFFQVRSILSKFKPGAVIGVGGYSSFPVLKLAQARGITTFIHESNSFAGRSNMMVGKKATRIFTGTPGMEKFFPPVKILVTGNPVRTAIAESVITRAEGLRFFSLEENKTTILVFGGSQGAKSINEAIDNGLQDLIGAGFQLIWQTGKSFAKKAVERAVENKHVWANDFIAQMEYAYAAADVVVSRSGAMTVAELCVAGKPVIFVPFPFAAEDHQTVNAMQLVNNNAALIIKDSEVNEKLVPAIITLGKNKEEQQKLKNNISRMAKTNADTIIADEVLKVMKGG
jgi:UDP-N-acetylglucosamine--N-acetylmuramyl-(pentapeptide) pyrophosphoryl-undecaprenol N-acetylglucosamine transferase